MVGMVIRRLLVKPQDFAFAENTPVQPEVRAGIFRDSTFVASFIIFHVGCRLMFKATQLSLDGDDPFQPVSSLFAGLFSGMAPGIVEASIISFGGAHWVRSRFHPLFSRTPNTFTFSSHRSLRLNKNNPGVLQPMDFENEETFGAAKLEDFTWPRFLDAYSCIMCNRCQDVCPATNTGKALSPAAIIDQRTI